AVMRAMSDRAGGKKWFEEYGTNKSRRFRYIGEDDDPLADMFNAKVVNDLKKYWRFCQDSAGFFPMSWIEYFFKDCVDLLDIKNKRQKGEQVLASSMDIILNNIELLPFLYESIVNRRVLAINYKPYEEELVELEFHPQYLREYNGRWHLLGHAKDKMPEWTFDIAIDRIVAKPRELYKVAYIPAPANFYKDVFNNRVGVSCNCAEPRKIRIRAHNINMYKLTETKPIHHSQNVIVPFGKHDDGEYGEFEIFVEINNEFIGKVLQMGEGLEVVSPDDVRGIFAKRVSAMHELYSK
ncbi:MAG: WYL domain-containing protein, partial [Prevotella sp.]|nr:WYL domain-containing protein [Prevotella sp.]